MKKFGILLAIAFQCMGVSPARAETNEHSCKSSDITGIYRLAYFKETPNGAEMKWYQDYPNQYLIFNDDGSYDFVASRHRLAKSEELQKSIALSKAEGNMPIVRKYVLDATGILTLSSNDKIDYTYRCIIIDKTQQKINAGDLFLSAYSKTNTLLEKFFRRGQ